jgi:hypothetical protein
MSKPGDDKTVPKTEEDQRRDEVLRRMLNTPHKKHEPLKPKPHKPTRKS